MAIAVMGGHVSRALDFYKAENKYFIIGGTQSWNNSSTGGGDTPISPVESDYKLRDIIGLKKVDIQHMVIKTDETENVIKYRDQNWKIVPTYLETTLAAEVVSGSTTIVLSESKSDLALGSKLRVANIYEGRVTKIEGSEITLDTVAPQDIPANEQVLGGAMVEGAKYVYVACYLNYDNFPVSYHYRQIGLCTGVIPEEDSKIAETNRNEGILLPAGINNTVADEFKSLGILEILDNRLPSSRDRDQRELLSLIVEF